MQALTEIILFASIALLGIGYFWKKRLAHIIRAFGWILFGVFWTVQAPYYVSEGDAINAIATGGSLIAFSFLGYHEYLSYKWNEEYEPLRFFAGVAFFAALIYFIVAKIPLFSGALIKVVTDQTVWLSNIGGGSYISGAIDYAGNPLWYKTNLEEITVPVIGANIDIILACTAIEAMAVAFSVVACTHAHRMKRLKVLALLLPTIYIVNLLRNATVIYLVSGLGWDFDFAHAYIGKTISLVTLFVLLLVVFVILPELYDNINGIFELPWRRAPNHDHKKYIGRLMNRVFK
jgi:archaeosortase A (PGF-CTERM-specific)